MSTDMTTVEPQNPHNLRCFNGTTTVKAHGVQQPYTKEQLNEYIRCSKDINYFIEKYCKIMTLDHGFTNITLRDYQKRFFSHIEKNRYTSAVWPRQSAKSTSCVLYILWKVLFTPDQTWFILANKLETAREIFSRLSDCYESLPFWLQQGVKVLNKSSIELSNGSSVTASATSKSAIRGRSGNVMIDEAAFIDQDEEFFTSVFPVISSGKDSKLILVSTPNGMNNMFYKVYQDCKKKKGQFRLMEIEWYEVPGRDDEWRKKMIDTIGRRKFDQEFSCSFLGNEGSLIPLDVLERISVRTPIKEIEGLYIYEEPQEDHIYVITVDVSRGSGLDYSAFSVIDVTSTPYTQVACYYNNEIPSMVYPHVIHEVGCRYNYAHTLIELNDAGCQVADILAHDLEYVSMLWVGNSGKGGQQVGNPNSAKPGVKTTKPVRTVGCSNLRLMMEQEKLEIWDKNTFAEMTAFVAKGDRYEADTGAHDDLMMTLVLFAWLIEQPYFADLTNKRTREDLVSDRLKKLEEAMIPFGFFDDGKNGHTTYEVVVVDYTKSKIKDEFTDWMLR